jgi:hypothetical protein
VIFLTIIESPWGTSHDQNALRCKGFSYDTSSVSNQAYRFKIIGLGDFDDSRSKMLLVSQCTCVMVIIYDDPEN